MEQKCSWGGKSKNGGAGTIGSAMTETKRDLTQGPLTRGILLFSLPLIASNLLQVLFNMSDIAVVGRFAGAGALGAVGSTTTLVTLFTGALIGLGAGVNALVARHYGAHQTERLKKTVHSALPVCLATGIALLLLGVTLSRSFLSLLGTKPDLIDGATHYLRIYSLGMPAVALYNFGSAVLSAIGDTRRPVLYLTAAGVCNIGLNLFFVLVCRMAEAGVALASILAQYLSALLILAALFRARGEYGLRLREMRPDADAVCAILRIGYPTGLQYCIFQIANLFIQGAVNSFDTVTVQGNAAAANADALVYDVMAAFYTAGTSFIGQNFGAGNRERVRRSYLISLGFSFGIAAVMGGALVLFGRGFLSLFTTDPPVIEAGLRRLSIMGLSYAVSAFMDCTIAASRGLGRSLVPTVIVIGGSCVFRVIWVYTVFAYYRTIPSLYLLYVCSWSLTAIVEIAYFIRIYRRLFQKENAHAAQLL